MLWHGWKAWTAAIRTVYEVDRGLFVSSEVFDFLARMADSLLVQMRDDCRILASRDSWHPGNSVVSFTYWPGVETRSR